MPTNLPPECLEAEQRYRAAKSAEEKAVTLEAWLSTIPKHKGTDRLRADLRRRLSKLKADSQTRKSAGKQASAFHIGREGAGQVVLVGPTNVGKSALLAALTNATPEVADYPFTTWTPTPGMMVVEDVQIQLIDTPPLNREAVEPELIDLIRRADLILLVVDLQTYPIEQLEETIAFLHGHRIVPRHLQERYTEPVGLTFTPLLVLANKNDDESSDGDLEVLCELLGDEWPLLPVSAVTERNLDRLRQTIFEGLEIMRIYSKPPGKPPDLHAPFVVRKGTTVAELAGKVHQDFLKNLKSARVWGSAAFDGQMVGRDHVLQDRDIVELRV
jgi:ribosome-interacting GTPase 1